MKVKAGFSVLVLLLLSIVSAHAQTLPCNGTDDDGNCPLDTWVAVLAFAALIFAIFHLYHRQSTRHQTCRPS